MHVVLMNKIQIILIFSNNIGLLFSMCFIDFE